MGMVASCLIPGSGMIKAEEYCVLGEQNRMRRSGSGLVSLHIKGMLSAQPFAISKNWLFPQGRGAISSAREGFLRCQKIIMYRK